MREYIIGFGTRSWEWFRERAESTHAKVWLFVLAFSESSFFVVPPDILLIAILVASARRWVYYGLLTTVGSVTGAVAGYIAAYFFYQWIGAPLVAFYGLEGQIAHIGLLFDENSFWVTFAAAFTPIPYKAFVLGAGFFHINFVSFLAASILGRGLRFLALSYIVARYGKHLALLTIKYFNWITAVIAVFGALWLLVSVYW